MQFLYIILTSIGSMLALFLSSKLIGNKQMSELNMFDYINGITIGSIAAEMALATERDDFIGPLIAITVYTLAVVFLSWLGRKRIRSSRLFSGRSILLMCNGKLYAKNFIKAKLELSEFLTQCRINGYFDLNEIETAMIEQNGRISIQPKSDSRPLMPKDLNLNLKRETPSITVISDGKVLAENLKATGNNEEWLKKQLDKQRIDHIHDVFLATCDSNNQLTVFPRITDAPDNDLFE